MNAIVAKQGQAVGRLIFHNQPVLTLPMIDELHDRVKKAANKAFINNKKMFVERMDYFDVPYDEWHPLLKVTKWAIRKVWWKTTNPNL